MSNNTMNHELDQLAAMFYQLGKAAAQIVSDHTQKINEDRVLTVTVARQRASAKHEETETEAVLEVAEALS